MRTEVMTLGNVDAQGHYVYPPVPAGGMPGYGGPDSTYGYGAVEPTWQINRAPMPPNTPQQPQNLLRPTDKTLSDKMSSVGAPVYQAYFLQGLGAHGGQHQDPQMVKQERDLLRMSYGYTALGYSLLGAVTAGVQLAGRKTGTGGIVLGVIGGALFPLLTNGAIFFWKK